MTSSADAKWIADLIRNEYDKAPDHYRMGDSWDDGAERIAAQIIERFGIRAQCVPTQLERANRIISWMILYIGTMCPPKNGLFDLNEHCIENNIRPNTSAETKGRPLNQRPAFTSPGRGQP